MEAPLRLRCRKRVVGAASRLQGEMILGEFNVVSRASSARAGCTPLAVQGHNVDPSDGRYPSQLSVADDRRKLNHFSRTAHRLGRNCRCGRSAASVNRRLQVKWTECPGRSSIFAGFSHPRSLNSSFVILGDGQRNGPPLSFPTPFCVSSSRSNSHQRSSLY